MFRVTLIVFVCFCCATSDVCPTGERRVSRQGKIDIINAHNERRLQIARGTVPKQPKGINLKKMRYDNRLGRKARVVSNTCKMAHIEINDTRWDFVGQNLYISRSSKYTTGQDWNRAISAWFNEYVDFVYPTTSRAKTGHYTQIVWAETTHVGCDFISFFNTARPEVPYTKLYTCNYGPTGNYRGEAPYIIGRSGCENLC